MWFETKRVFLTAGSARGRSRLTAFDNALREARIVDFNLIRVTSIVPTGVAVSALPTEQPIDGDGAMLPAVYEAKWTASGRSRIAAGVAVGVPRSLERPGVIFAYSANGTAEEVREVLGEMVAEGMESRKVGSEFELKVAVAEAFPKEHLACAFAGVIFCDEHLLQKITK